MYSVYIEDIFWGHFDTKAEAFEFVEQTCFYCQKWYIKDPQDNICMEGVSGNV